MATSTVENYLKAILRAERRPGEVVGMGSIAAQLSVSPGTVTGMAKTLHHKGLVDYEPYSGVKLQPGGRSLALRVLRRHRLLELFLVRVMGMSWSEVHGEAEVLEHVVSDRVIERVDEMLGHPSVDPHGDPIPDADGGMAEVDLVSLSACSAGQSVAVRRVGDQAPSFLQLLDRLGLAPGSAVVVVHRDDTAEVTILENGAGERVQIGNRAACKIYVAPAAA